MGLLDKYPIDVAALSKGQLLTPPELQKITGKAPTDEKWPFAILALREFIQDHTDFTVKITVDGLRILTDSEAAQHNHRRFNGHIMGAFRRHERNALVDVEGLMPEERTIHARNLINESRYVSAIQQTTKRITVQAHKRTLPTAEELAGTDSRDSADVQTEGKDRK